jgi:hypothetical protein
MPKYFAEIGANNVVFRVIVADSIEWCQSRLSGTWIETADPYAEEPQEINYCGKGYMADETFPERFAPPWVVPEVDPETGVWSSYAKGAVVAYDGRLWKSTIDGNVWEPGISAWHPEPEIEGVLRPLWIQPTGAHDTWAEGVEVEREIDGVLRYFRSGIPNNATVPGDPSSGPPWNYWIEIDVDGNVIEPEPGEEWVDTGVTLTQLVGAGIYRVSGIPTLTLNQEIRLGDTEAGETVFTGYWPTTGTPSDYIKISPHVSAAVGSKVWKWE